MAERTYRGGRDRYDRERNQGYDRQAEQFDTTEQRWRDNERGYGQMGDGWREEDYGQFDTGGQSYRRERARQPSDYAGDYRGGRYEASPGRGFGSFTGSDFGGRDFSSPRYTATRAFDSGAGSRLAEAHGEWHEERGATPSRENRDFRDTWGRSGDARGGHERGFLERAGDTLAGWLGDETVPGRQNYRGRGPANYSRSDERILEDACDALTEDWGVDARNIQVSVVNAELTLDGTVPSRDQKRRAEDCVEDLSGVKNVQNNLRVQEPGAWDRNNSSDFTGSES
ncbi:MAG TPA: BON domain-containing protein [Croceibacterium sp.]|nr:BON domain-containing protein [Croceibacterium sp.]